MGLGPVLLESGDASCAILPDPGARLLHWRIGGLDILRPASPKATATGFAYGFAGFPILPWCGPVFGGGFRWDGAFHPLARNVPMEADATHGHGWTLPWTVTVRDLAHCRLETSWQPHSGGFPFRWTARLDISVSAQALAMTLAITNRDWRDMPAAVGFHPYFPRPPGSRLTFSHTGVWPFDDAARVGEGAGPSPAGLDFSVGQELSATSFDRCFEGWDGRANGACHRWRTVQQTARLRALGRTLCVHRAGERGK
jgi:aldose 1-epimerase